MFLGQMSLPKGTAHGQKQAKADWHKLKSKSSIFKFLQVVFYKILSSTSVNVTC